MAGFQPAFHDRVAGADGIDADILARVIHGHGFGHEPHGALARDVRERVRPPPPTSLSRC